MIKQIGRLLTKRKTLVDVLFILFLGLHVFIGLKGGLLYIGGDTGIPLNPIKDLKLLSLWQNQEAGISGLSLGIAFQLAFFAFFELLGFSLAASQHLFIYFAHALAALAMYYLVNSFELKNKRAVALIATVFYMFSPWIINYMSIFVFLPYSVMPLILGLFVRGLTGQISQLKSILLIILSFFGIIINFPQYSMYFVAVLLMALYFLFYILVEKGKFWSSLKYVFILFLFLGLTSLWFVIPYLSFFFSVGMGSELEKMAIISTSLQEFGDFGYATILHLLRMFGAAGFMAGGATYSEAYASNPLLAMISFLIPILVFSSLLLKPRSKNVSFFGLVAIVFLFLAKGVNPPFGQLHFWLVTYFPLARAFRTTWNLSVGANLAYAFLLGVATVEIASRWSRKKSSYFFTIVGGAVILILINSWPLVTGAYFQFKWNPPSFEGVKIPQAYFDLENYLVQENLDSRFLRFPYGDGKLSMDWGYFGSDFYFTLFSTPFIDGHPVAREAKGLIASLYQDFEDQPQVKTSTFNTLALLNVNRFLFDGYDSKPEPKDKLLSLKQVSLEKEFGPLTVYQIDNQYFLPHFYIPQKLIYTNAEPEQFKQLADLPGYQIETGIMRINEEDDLSQDEDIDEAVVRSSSELSLDLQNRKERVLESLDLSIVFFPHARWRPGSLLYPLIKKKEQLEMKLINSDPRSQVDRSLFFASKRIVELENWGGVLSKDQWQEITDRYNQLFDHIFNQIAVVYQSGKESLFVDLLSRTKSVFLVHQGRMTSLLPYHRADLDDEEVMTGLFDSIEKRLKGFTQIPNLFSLSYHFYIPQTGYYRIFFTDPSHLFSQIFPTITSAKIGAQELTIEAIEKGEGIVQIKDEVYLDRGEYQLELTLASETNLLSVDNWQEQIGPLVETESGLMTFRFQKPFPQQEPPIALQPINNYTPNTYYLLSFDYLAKSDQAGFAVVQDVDIDNKTGEIKPLLTRYLPGFKDDQFHHLETVFRSDLDSEKATFYLLARQEQGRLDKIQFKNLRIEPVFQPAVIFQNQMVINPKIEEQQPEITFSRVNSTKYRLLIRGASKPYHLIFSESYHPGWRLYFDRPLPANQKMEDSQIKATYLGGRVKEGIHQDVFLDKNTLETWGKREIAQESHSLINGYANLWQITPEDTQGAQDYELILEFKPQQLFYLGTAFSLLVFLVFLGLAVYLGRKREIK